MQCAVAYANETQPAALLHDTKCSLIAGNLAIDGSLETGNTRTWQACEHAKHSASDKHNVTKP